MRQFKHLHSTNDVKINGKFRLKHIGCTDFSLNFRILTQSTLEKENKWLLLCSASFLRLYTFIYWSITGLYQVAGRSFLVLTLSVVVFPKADISEKELGFSI